MQAVLFDLDGVIIDSHDQHEAAWEQLAVAHGKTLPPNFFKESFGMRNQSIFATLLPWSDDAEVITELSEEKEAIYRKILAASGLDPLPGAADILTQLADVGIPAVLATSTPRSNVSAVMEATGLGPLFRDVVCGCDVANGKPDPEVFLKAAAAAHADPTRCVVIEDAQVGIRAGLAAGCKVLALTTTHPKEAIAKENPTAISKSLEGVTVDFLKKLW